VNLGVRDTLADMGQTIAENFGGTIPKGKSFLNEMRKASEALKQRGKQGNSDSRVKTSRCGRQATTEGAYRNCSQQGPHDGQREVRDQPERNESGQKTLRSMPLSYCLEPHARHSERN